MLKVRILSESAGLVALQTAISIASRHGTVDYQKKYKGYFLISRVLISRKAMVLKLVPLTLSIIWIGNPITSFDVMPTTPGILGNIKRGVGSAPLRVPPPEAGGR